MDNTARVAGYGLAFVILMGLLSLVYMLREGVLFPHNRIKVQFSSIGTLMQDDPVKMHGVEVGRVDRIEAGIGGPVVTLELYRRVPLAKDTRFVDFNYSLFGARMVVLVPGTSKEPMDQRMIQPGDFSSGVTETIHRVDALLATVLEYKDLSRRLEVGSDSGMSLQQVLTTRIYPALEEFGNLSRELDTLEGVAGSQLDQLGRAGTQLNRIGAAVATNSDTLIARANHTLEELTLLTAQSTVLLHGMEKLMAAAEDTTHGSGRLLMQRDLYDRTLALTHALQDLLKLLKKEGLKDQIHFWKNVHFHRVNKPR